MPTNAQTFYPHTTDQDQAWGTDIRKLDTASPATNSFTLTYTTVVGSGSEYFQTVDPYTNTSAASPGNDNRTNFGWAWNEDAVDADAMDSESDAKRKILAGTWTFEMRVGMNAPANSVENWQTQAEISVYRVATGGGTRTLLFTMLSNTVSRTQLTAAEFTLTASASQSQIVLAAGETLHVAYRMKGRATSNLLGGQTNQVLTFYTGTQTAVPNIVSVPSPGIRTEYLRNLTAIGDGEVSRDEMLVILLERSATGDGRVRDTSETLHSDTFTDTAGTDLISHSPEIGSSYFEQYAPGQFVITNANRIRDNTAVSVDLTTVDLPADLEVSFDQWMGSGGPALGGATEYVHVLARSATAQFTAYGLGLIYSGGVTYLGLYKWINNAPSVIQLHGIVGGWPSNFNPSIRWRITGNRHRVWLNNVPVIDTTDNAISGAGRLGFRGVGPTTNTTGIHIDNLNVKLLPLKHTVAARTFNLQGDGFGARDNSRVRVFLDVMGDGDISYERETIAEKSFNVVGQGEAQRNELLAVLIPRSIVGQGITTLAKETIAAKTFTLLGEGVITENHPVQAFRTYNLLGEGEVTRDGLDIVPADFNLQGDGDTAYTRQTIASKTFDLLGEGFLARDDFRIRMIFDLLGEGFTDYNRETIAARTFSLVGEGLLSDQKRIAFTDFTLLGEGVTSYNRAVAAAKFFDLLGQGVSVQDALLIAFNTFGILGEGLITEVHPVQAFRTFNLIGDGYVPISGATGSTITVPLDELPTGDESPITIIKKQLFIFDD